MQQVLKYPFDSSKLVYQLIAGYAVGYPLDPLEGISAGCMQGM